MMFDNTPLYHINSMLSGTRYSLFSLATWKNGIPFKSTDTSITGKPIIKISELNNGITANTSYTQMEYNDDVHLHKGDLLFSWSGNPNTSIDVFRYQLQDGWLNQHIFKVTPNNEIITNDFFYYLMKFLKPIFTKIASNKQTTGLGHIAISDIKRLNVIIPEIDTQEKIVNILKDYDDMTNINNQLNDNLEQQAKALFCDLFIASPSPTWKKGTISDLGTVVGGSTPSKSKPEYYTDHGIAWITPKDLSVDKSKFLSHGAVDITELGLKNSSATILPPGTVLFSSRAPIGYIAICDGEVTTNQGFKSIIPFAHIGTPYVYYFLKSALPVIESMAAGSTFKEVSGSVMRTIPAIIPDADTISRFTTFCTPLFNYQKILEQQNRKLSMIRDSLLPKLISGEIAFYEKSV